MSLQKLFRAICVLPECCLAAEEGSVPMTAGSGDQRQIYILLVRSVLSHT